MHIRKTKHGYQAIVQHQGVKRSVSARTRAEAQHAGAALLLELGGTPKASDLTVGAVVHGFLAEKESTWSPSTYDDRVAVMKLVPPAFMNRSADTVTVPVVLGLWRTMKQAGVTPHRVHRAGKTLSAAFTHAIKHGQIAGPNAFHLSPPPTPPKAEMVLPTVDQVRALLDADSTLYLMLRLAATTGARRGELCGLQWADVDFDRATLSIRRNLVQVAGRPLFERQTKTGEKGQRVVTLDAVTLERLQAHQAAQLPPSRLGLGSPVWVFSDDHGQTPWRPNAITNRFAHHRKRRGVEGVRLQDLRHYVATTMLLDGESPHDVANQLGHASTSTTLKVYARYVPGRNREAIDRLAARLD